MHGNAILPFFFVQFVVTLKFHTSTQESIMEYQDPSQGVPI
jgi:hypothetical protein